MYTQSSQEWYCGRPYTRRLLAVGQIPASGPAERIGPNQASWIVSFLDFFFARVEHAAALAHRFLAQRQPEPMLCRTRSIPNSH